MERKGISPVGQHLPNVGMAPWQARTYAEECIEGVRIEYQDNSATLALLETPPLGIFRLLDSAGVNRRCGQTV